MATMMSPANQQLPIDLYRIPVNKGTNLRLDVDKIHSKLSTMTTVGTEEKAVVERWPFWGGSTL